MRSGAGSYVRSELLNVISNHFISGSVQAKEELEPRSRISIENSSKFKLRVLMALTDLEVFWM